MTTVIYIKSTSDVIEMKVEICQSICEALKFFELETQGICGNDANVVTAEAAIVFLLERLKSQGSFHAHQLHATVKTMIVK